MIAHRRFHRAVFLLAGLYNIGWGLFSALDPQWVFRRSGMPESNHPEIFACLAMVVGVYGLLYLEVARAPERGWAIAAVGLLGKILGPAGMLALVAAHRWPLSAAAIITVPNDLVWWIPFALYLKDARGFYRARS
jgi:hypothetical protein